MMSSRPAKRGQRTGVAVGRPTWSIMKSGAASVGSASARLARIPSQMTRFNQRPAVVSLIIVVLRPSEGLEVFHDGVLVAGRQRGAVLVAHVAVARHRGVVAGESPSAGFRDGRHEADALLIEDVVA